ncbi:Alpha-tubulin [Hexamita inflata]|uniref:Alpha-tubulin n=1 Tax=Hexamita inflata TaxID=28002 RepID=A0AA86UQA9_9EUKA|nr:Alpha-tubulin [Hexamita inflata]
MREVINVHVGHTGAGIGEACWELFCLEHDISPSGVKDCSLDYCSQFTSFFSESSNKFTPRAVFTHSDNFQFKDLCTDNYSTEEQIRKQAENCSNLQGFILYRSIKSESGSQIGSEVLERIREYQKCVFDISVFPDINGSGAEVVNAILASRSADCIFALQNEAIIDICKRNLDIEQPTLKQVNMIAAHFISDLTAGMRFDEYSTQMVELSQYLVPRPRLNTVICSRAPVTSKIAQDLFTSQSISKLACEPSQYLIRCNTRNTTHFAFKVIYRGDVVPKDVSIFLNHIKGSRTVQFADWCHTNFGAEINYQSKIKFFEDSNMTHHERSCITIQNSTAIAQVWNEIRTKFDRIQLEKSEDLLNAREDLNILEAEYEEAGQHKDQ